MDFLILFFILNIDIFGISLPEGLFYSGIIAMAIFYAITVYLVVQVLRRSMPTRVFKATVGQGLMSFKAKMDDLKLYWREGSMFGGSMLHTAWKNTKERLMPRWGVTNRVFLVREDWNATVPFLKVFPKISSKLLCRNCLRLAEDMVNVAFGKLKKGDPLPPFIETDILDVSKFCNDCKRQFYIMQTKDLKTLLCDPCQTKIPEALTVDFVETDELKGSSTEAHEQRKNEDFVRTVAKESKKVRKGEMLTGLVMGVTIGMMIMLAILIASGVVKIF